MRIRNEKLIIESTMSQLLRPYSMRAQIAFDQNTIFGLVGTVIPIFASVIQYLVQLQKRISWVNKAKKTIGNLGSTYWWIDDFPNKLSIFALIMIMAAAFISLAEGITKLTSGASLSKISDFLFTNALWMLFIWFLVALFIQTNFIPFLLLHLLKVNPATDYSPGWINASWHIAEGENAVPVNVNIQSCERIANDTVKAWGRGFDSTSDRALPIAEIGREELANLFLFGCVIEGRLHELGVTLQWRAFYSALGQAARNDSRPFTPLNVMKGDWAGMTFYEFLSELCKPYYELPNEPSVDVIVSKARTRLITAYQGSAWNFAFSFWSRRSPSVKVAAKAAATVPGLDAGHETMRTQFLKLAVGQGVWSEIDPGPFVFPFSRPIAAMLLNEHCLITYPEAKSLPLVEDRNMQHLIAHAEGVITDKVNQILVNTSDHKIQEYCLAKFGCRPSAVPLWKLSYEVDYQLWYLANHRDVCKDTFGWDISAWQWQLTDKVLVRP